jgi:hypothetical protein
VGVAQDPESPGLLGVGVAAEGVLARGGAVEDQIHVGSRLPWRQWVAVDLVQRDGDDPVRDEPLGLADHGVDCGWHVLTGTCQK